MRSLHIRLQRLRRRLSHWIITHPTGRWVVFGSVVGLLCGMAAAVFEIGTDLVAKALLESWCGLPQVLAASHPADLSLAGRVSPVWLLVVMAGGGLLAGIIIARWSLAARGGGTGVAVHAFHHQRGAIPLAAPWTKLVASIASLGSGGSGGREGPISLIGAGFGSWFATRMHLSARDRRILLAAGIAAGIAAVFRAPLAAAIFAAEVMYRGPDLDADVLVPAFIAAVVGYLTGSIGIDVLGPLVGQAGAIASTTFAPPSVSFRVADWMHLGGYSLIAFAAAIVARLFIALETQAGGRFERLTLPLWLKPCLGAFGAGIIAIAIFLAALLVLGAHDEALISLSTIGSGYGVLHWLFAGLGGGTHPWVLAGLLAVIAIGKSATTALTVGSGGSAGLFGPCIVIGGCTGGAVAFALTGLPIAPPPAAGILMGMAAMLAATHRTPVAALLMVSEIGGTWLLLLPAMWVSGLAFLLTGHRSLIGGQVDGIEDSPAHRSHLFTDVLAQTTVASLLGAPRDWVVVPASTPLSGCLALVQSAAQDHFPVVRADGRLAGLINRSDVVRVGSDPLVKDVLLADDLVEGAGLALRPDDSLATALRRLHQQRVDELPVVDGDRRYLGMVSSGLLMEQYRLSVDRTLAERHADQVRSATDGELPSGGR